LAWKTFQPRAFRISHINAVPLSNSKSINPKALSHFWSTSMMLPARTLCYRVSSQKNPHTAFLYRIQTVDSPLCRSCLDQEDTMSHFLISCSHKKAIWTSVLTHLFPTFDFSVEDTLAMLYRLQSPFTYGSYLHKPYTVAIASILWNIWFAYWQKIIHNVPFQPESIIKKTLSQISILLTPSSSSIE
jgi:hypothetical protein